MAEAEVGATDVAETKGSEETVSLHALTPAVISSVTINSHVTRTESGIGKTKYTAFIITVQTVGGQEWSVERRYSEFSALNKILSKRYERLRLFKFPPKKWFSSLARGTIDKRRKAFESYLQELHKLQPRPLELNQFLEINEHVWGTGLTGDGNMPFHRRDSFTRLRNGQVTVDDFELLKVLGKGSFGKVFLVRLIPTGGIYAMKVLKKSEVVRRRQVEHTKAERRIMEGVDHPFIVQLRFAFQTADKLYMVTDYCRGGELFFHLKNFRVFPENMVRFYMAELTLALEHLHDNDVVYRDLKPENVLLDETGHIRLADFGLSKDEVVDDRSAMTFCGTPEYLAPEMLLNRKSRRGYGKSVDWWSLGTLAFEMMTGWPPFYHKNLRQMCRDILEADLRFPSSCHASPEARNMIQALLIRNPKKRANADTIKQHPFFAGLDWEKLAAKEVTPPFIPKAASDTDITNFDTAFTEMDAALTPPAESEMDQAVAAKFEDFSFVDDSVVADVDGDDDEGASTPAKDIPTDPEHQHNEPVTYGELDAATAGMTVPNFGTPASTAGHGGQSSPAAASGAGAGMGAGAGAVEAGAGAGGVVEAEAAADSPAE